MPWKKGQSGNPRGGNRPQKSIAEAIRKLLKERDAETGELNQAKLVTTLWNLAVSDRSLDAIKVILDRADGKVPEAATETDNDVSRVEIVRRGQDGTSRVPPEAG